jgi:CRP/FNR family nitrogen fixation transcriptional regulator
MLREKPAGGLDAMAVTTRYCRGQRIYAREDPVDHWYRIVAGLARKSTVFTDGRRRIVDFMLPGDFFGFSARRERYFDVEAVLDGTDVSAYPRCAIEARAETDPDIARQLRALAFESISRLQARILILGRVTALEKVRAFLVEMAERGDTNDVLLQMSRYDIADYLAVSVETVSRAITHLQHRGSIALEGKHQVKLIDRGVCA